MRRIPLDAARDGDILAQNIFDVIGRILLRSGTRLSEKLIRKISDHKIYSVYIADDSDDIDSIVDVISPVLRAEAINNVKKIYKEFVNEESVKDIKSGKINLFKENPYVKELQYTVDFIIDEVLLNKDALVELVDIKKMDNYIYEHSVNVAVLSLVVGLELKLNEKDLRKMVIASLLMDIGNNFVNQDSLKAERKLNDKEYEDVKEHVAKGYEFLRDCTDINVYIRNIILQHHERIDGKGYPYSLKGDNIDRLAKIISIADTYDSLTSDRPFRPAYNPDEALELIMGSAGTQFDFKLVNVFAKKVMAYPEGTFVELSNGDRGEVLAVNKDIPLRPVVEILKHKDEFDVAIARDLSKELNLTVKRVIFRLDDV